MGSREILAMVWRASLLQRMSGTEGTFSVPYRFPVSVRRREGREYLKRIVVPEQPKVSLMINTQQSELTSPNHNSEQMFILDGFLEYRNKVLEIYS